MTYQEANVKEDKLKAVILKIQPMGINSKNVHIIQVLSLGKLQHAQNLVF